MPKFAANLSMLFTELPFLDRFEAAANAGFKGVEFLFPYEHDPAELRGRLDQFGLEQVLFNMPPGDWSAGERGIAIYQMKQAAFREGVNAAKSYAKKLGCKRIHCLAGIAQVNADHRLMRATYVENLRYAADALAEDDVTLLIEPINTRDIKDYYLDATAKALDVIESVGADNLMLQYDIYHMQIMEGDLAPTLSRHLDKIGHVQIADTPGRHEPGTGEINYPFLFDHLESIGYQGWVGLEYNPKTTTAESLAWLRAWRETQAATS